MNAIAMAMKDAGVPIPPLIKRVWLWLHDHPDKTYKEVANALGEKPNNVSSTLGLMGMRGMVTTITHKRRTGDGMVTHYSTIGKEYELLPLPKKKKLEPAPSYADFALPKVTTTPVVTTYDSTPKPFDPMTFTDNLTMSHARAVYTYLQGVFS